jgi:hypothetical protein
MCDYSLEHVASRPAAVADRLVTTSFPNSITRGFAAVDDVNVAVCVLPGTEIAFDANVAYEHPVTYARQTIPSQVARFRELDPDLPYAHHDALEFPGGEIVPLTRLVQGQTATVLQLPAQEKPAVAKADEPAASVASEMITIER